LLAVAELRAVTGRREDATAALEEARAILGPLQAAPALARAGDLADLLVVSVSVANTPAAFPFGLTAREAEVLALLAEGLTDPQIAARLFVSRNTVATHVRAVYGKLGVNTRSAAARLATEHGLA
jgi:DNA-binding CsgD family transcriptional regulator